jgi:hypothetical protein
VVARGGAFITVVAGVMALALVAFAANSAVVTIDPTAHLGFRGSSVTVSGTVTCTYPKLGALTGNITDTDTLAVSVSQRVGRGIASGSTTQPGPPCDGVTHAWSATVPNGNDVRFSTGKASATAQYTATAFATGGVETDQNGGSTSATITIVNP